MNAIDSQKQTIKFMTDEMYTCEVAKVLEFYDDSTADVSFLIKEVYSDGTYNTSPMTLQKVPVRYPQMGNFVMYAPLVKGDVVFLHFSRTDWDNWLLNSDNKAVVLADGTDKHTHNCAYIEVGARNVKNPSRRPEHKDKFHLAQGDNGEQYLTMDSSGGINLVSNTTTVHISPQGAVNIIAPADVNITGNLNVSGNVISQGDVLAKAISLTNHMHDIQITGGSSAGNYRSLASDVQAV